MKQFSATLATVQQVLNAATGMVLVGKGVRLQGAPGSADPEIKNTIAGFQEVVLSNGLKAATVSAQVRKPGTWLNPATGQQEARSFNYPKIFVPTQYVEQVRQLSADTATVDLIAGFDTTYTKSVKWVPASEIGNRKVLSHSPVNPEVALAPQMCYPVADTAYGYKAELREIALAGTEA